MKRKERDIEKMYSKQQFVSKLLRFANALEKGKPFTIQILEKRTTVPSENIISIEHERDSEWEEVEFQIKWKLRQKKSNA